MPIMPDLSRRCREPEIMDLPRSNGHQLRNTLRQFRLINRLLTPCHHLLRRYLLSAMRKQPDRRWSLLDVGAGGGDLARWIARQCREMGIAVDVTCLDHDKRVVRFAERACQSFPNIRFIEGDFSTLEATKRNWDFVFANHFLHHLDDEQIDRALRLIHRVCRWRYVLSDIHRLYSAYFGYSAVAAIWLRNSFAFHDGRLSIRKGFSVAECQAFIERAELNGQACVKRFFPMHLAIVKQLPGAGW